MRTTIIACLIVLVLGLGAGLFFTNEERRALDIRNRELIVQNALAQVTRQALKDLVLGCVDELNKCEDKLKRCKSIEAREL